MKTKRTKRTYTRNNNRCVDSKFWCPTCRKYLDKDSFWKSNIDKHGVSSNCKKCNRLTSGYYSRLKYVSTGGSRYDRRMKITDKDLAEVVRLKNKGMKMRDIAKIYGISKSGMTYVWYWRILKSCKNNHYYNPNNTSEKPRKKALYNARAKEYRNLLTNLGLIENNRPKYE